MDKSLVNVPPAVATDLTDESTMFVNAGQHVMQTSISEMRSKFNENDEMILEGLAFYIDVNIPYNETVTDKTKRVYTGGNSNMKRLWQEAKILALMDDKGNYCKLNPADARYTQEGNAVVADTTVADSTLASAFAGADVMVIIPETYCRVQMRGDNSLRLWISLSRLPGGYKIPRQVVGKFKASVDGSGKLRSVPGAAPANDYTINEFYDMAQDRSANHGLANLNFNNILLFHMMAVYGWRSSQECKDSDDFLVWGVGLDGTESNDGFTDQKTIKTGGTLNIGLTDGYVTVEDDSHASVTKVNVAGFEDPWGQYTEMRQGLCSVSTYVYVWDHNYMPAAGSAPTNNTFNNVDCIRITRSITNNSTGMTMLQGDQQGVYMIPKETLANVAYGDEYVYGESGQVFTFGGSASDGSNCGLASMKTNGLWDMHAETVSSRLAYYGPIHQVSETRLRELLS